MAVRVKSVAEGERIAVKQKLRPYIETQPRNGEIIGNAVEF